MNETYEVSRKLPGASEDRIYTYDEVVAEIPETAQPCEIWDGKLLMSPTPSFHHQKIVLRFYVLLDEYVSKHNLGEAIAAPVDMVLSPHRVVQPDVAYIAKDRLHIIQRVIMGPVDLAVEIVFLGGRNRDRIEKRDLYEQYGIKEYWIVDPESEMVEVLFLEAGRYQLFMRSSAKQEASSGLLPGFKVPLPYLFHGPTYKP
jgi:Uma2 family endonuclease